MARLTQGFEYQPIIAPYAPAPVDEFRESLNERSSVYDKNIEEMDKLDILASNIDVLDPDKEIKLAEIDKIRSSLKQVSEVGAENATNLVRLAARDFAGNQNLKQASSMYLSEQQRQEDLRQLKLKGLTPYDFTPEYQGIKNTPDWKPQVETANDVLSDAKNYIGKIRDKFKDMGISFKSGTGPDGVTYTYAVTGNGSVVSDEMLQERAGEVIDEFMQSPRGGNQYARWTSHNGLDSRQQALEMLKTAGLEQVGETKNINYSIIGNNKDELAASRRAVPDQGNGFEYERGPKTSLTKSYGKSEIPYYGGVMSGISRLKNKAIAKISNNSNSDSLRQLGIPHNKGDYSSQYNNAEYNNDEVREETYEPVIQALGMANPDLTEEELINMVDNMYSDKSQFILSRPEVEKSIKLYNERIQQAESAIPIYTKDMLNTSTRAVDKNFSLSNVQKDIETQWNRKTFQALDDDGNMIPNFDTKIKKAMTEDPESVKIYIEGVGDVMNPFGSDDPNSNIEMSELFAQPYMATITIDDEKYNTAISRPLGEGVIGRDANREDMINSHRMHKQTVSNLGNYVELDIKHKGVKLSNPPKAKAYIDDDGSTMYIVEKTVRDNNGKPLIIRSQPQSNPYLALEDYLMQYFNALSPKK